MKLWTTDANLWHTCEYFDVQRKMQQKLWSTVSLVS